MNSRDMISIFLPKEFLENPVTVKDYPNRVIWRMSELWLNQPSAIYKLSEKSSLEQSAGLIGMAPIGPVGGSLRHYAGIIEQGYVMAGSHLLYYPVVLLKSLLVRYAGCIIFQVR